MRKLRAGDPPGGRAGPRPKWCSRGCRQRAYERRKLDRARAEGRAQALAEQPRRKLLA